MSDSKTSIYKLTKHMHALRLIIEVVLIVKQNYSALDRDIKKFCECLMSMWLRT